MIQNKTPSQLGFRMPAEWEPHEATWLSWPHNPDTWPGKIEPIPQVWVDMIRALSVHEKVYLNVNNQKMKNEAERLLTNAGIKLQNIIFQDIPTNDCWMRDAGPIFITRDYHGKKELALTDWIFNKWGRKYSPWDLDNQIPSRIAEKFQIPSFKIDIVMEGGSIDVNGQGSLLTTESCLLNKNRNPHLSKKEIEQYLKDYLGVTNILWLGDGIAGDDTDGHVDDITRFVNLRTVVTAIEEDPQDENYKPLQDNLKRLQKITDEQGRALHIIQVPMPGPVIYKGQRLPASYANFYIANGVVLVPTYRHPNDQKALSIFEKLFPTRRVMGIDSIDLIWGLGAFHCITQQQPK